MKNNRLLVLGGAAVILPLLIVSISWYPCQLGAGLLLLSFLPGYAFLAVLWPDVSPASAERWLLAVAAGYGLTITLLLLMVFVGIPLSGGSVAGGLGALTLLFTLIAWARRTRVGKASPVSSTSHTLGPASGLPAGPTFQIGWLVFILLVAAFFRITNVHYSDHQGDEADILLRAVSLVYGQTEAILTHSKGPGEILLINTIGALTGRFDELTVRLPFALAGTVSVGLIILMGWRLLGFQVGVVAGLLASIDGVFVSYARTAQYQSVVLLLTLAAIYSYYRFYEDSQTRRWHMAGTFLLATSFLVHFETVLLLPVAAYLTVASGLAPIWRLNLSQLLLGLKKLWPSALIFLTLTASFYLPFLLHPHLSKTGTYLENRIGGGSLPPFNNLAHFFYFEALKYNSAYYVTLFNLLLVLVVGTAWIIIFFRQKAGESRSRSSLLFLLTLMGPVFVVGGLVFSLAQAPKLSAAGVGLGAALFFALVILSPYTSVSGRVLWLWLAPPFWIYIFLVNRPGKHHYLFLAALLILVAAQIEQLWQWGTARWGLVKQPAGRWLIGGLSLVLVVIFAAHTVMVLLRSDLEYVLTYPAHKSAFYPTDAAYPYGTRIGFGYPFRLGWQAIGLLKRTGRLEKSWGGNDAGNAPDWYMLNTPATSCYPHYVLQGEITYKGKEDFQLPFEPAKFGYVPRYRIWGNDRLRMTVLEFDPDQTQTEIFDLYEPFRFDQPVTAADFGATIGSQGTPRPDMQLDPPLVLGEGSELKNNAPAAYLERAQQLNGRVTLLGYDLEEAYAQAGSILPVTLYWQTSDLLSLRYKIFLHLVSEDGRLWAQADSFPACGQFHTNTWPPGEIRPDRHLIKLPADMPPGDYRLVTGMYEPNLSLRLNYFDVAGNEQGNSLTVGTVTIREP